jgi:hypothetical protein
MPKRARETSSKREPLTPKGNRRFLRRDSQGRFVVPGFEIRLEEPCLRFGAGFPIGLTEEAEEWGVIVDVEVEF